MSENEKKISSRSRGSDVLVDTVAVVVRPWIPKKELQKGYVSYESDSKSCRIVSLTQTCLF